jgi:quinoprotein glucose dehydrogenase
MTGEVVAEIELPGPPNGTPMTYMKNGKQYIAIAVGGGRNAQMVALTLSGD